MLSILCFIAGFIIGIYVCHKLNQLAEKYHWNL